MHLIKRDASSFFSKESLLEQYQADFDISSKIESFEVKTNYSPYTNSMIGSSDWLNATLSAVHDIMTYIESKDMSRFDAIKKLNATALKQMEELIENRHLLIKY